MSRDDRPKASDLFPGKLPFETEFREVADYQIEVTPDVPPQRTRATHYYTRDNPPKRLFDCDKYICYGGGISIEDIVRKMVKDRSTEFSETLFCRGYEGSPKGRDKYRLCMLRFEVRIHLTYTDT